LRYHNNSFLREKNLIKSVDNENAIAYSNTRKREVILTDNKFRLELGLLIDSLLRTSILDLILI